MATAADAELILRLYDLRRESVCRKARAWFAGWKPADEAEARRIATEPVEENAFYRQATSYWEMAFSLANQGCIDADLFARNCGEGLIYAVKCAHLKARFPDAPLRSMPEAEAFIAGNAIAQKKAETFKARFA